MDATKFTEFKTGKLVQIKTPTGSDHAFVPDDLPPNWQLPNHLVPKLVAASRALSRLDGIGQTLPDPELLMVPLRRREAITSSRIEGTYATAEELMLFEMNATESKAKQDQVNAWREVSNYSTALSKGLQLLEEMPFCGRIIKELHKILMRGVRGQNSRAGEWRDYQVAIGSDRRYIPPPHNELLRCIEAFEKYINAESNYDPLIKAFMAHYQFEAVHPFGDGNGRIGRVLLSLMIAKWCELSLPWLYMSSFFEKFKNEYVDNLFRISSEGQWDKWFEFCLNGTIHQANDAIIRCEKLRDLKENMLQRTHQGGSPRTERIISSLFSNPMVRVSDLRKKLDVSYPTAQSDVNRLVKAKILAPLEDLRPKCYYAPEIFAIAYAEQDTGIENAEVAA